VSLKRIKTNIVLAILLMSLKNINIVYWVFYTLEFSNIQSLFFFNQNQNFIKKNIVYN